jgi:hypothetical protein
MKILIPIYLAMLALSFWFYYEVQEENKLKFENQTTQSIKNIINENKEVNNYKMRQIEPSEESSSYSKNVDYCSTCGTEITGVPYEAFARKYCDMRCYADDPDM